MKDKRIISEDEYIIQNGGEEILGASIPMSKMAGQSRSHIRSTQALLEGRLEDICQKREYLRNEYRMKVRNGELRKPTNEENLIRTANGNPDNPAVQAARRCCLKRGIQWDNVS